MTMRLRALVAGLLSLSLIVSAAIAFTTVASAQRGKPRAITTPTSDIVGIGLFNCAVVTGELGFSPATITSGSSTTPETVSVWFRATKCSSVPGVATKPLPTTVIGSESFLSKNGNLCPQLGTLGTGVLNLTYNFPPVPNPIIDPSVGQSVTVTEVGPNWDLTGAINAGSYPSGNFKAVFHPILVGPETCASGVTSMWINHGTLSNV